MQKHVNGLKTKKRIIRLKGAHQRLHYEIGYLVLVQMKEKIAFIIFVYGYANVISTRIKANSRVQKSWKKISQEIRKINQNIIKKRLKTHKFGNYLPN